MTSVRPKDQLDRSNNFDFLRVTFAIFVLISHSFAAYGLKEGDWLLSISRNLVSFSDLGLGGFFALSGCLVYQSMQRSATYRNFIKKRMLRVFPGLIVMFLLVAFVIGRIVSGLHSYYLDLSPYTYVLRGCLLFNQQWVIKGVFTNNPYPNVVNASLWTIPYEFLFYLLFIVFYLKRSINHFIIKSCVPIFFILLFLRWRYPEAGYPIPFTAMPINKIIHFALWFIPGLLLGYSMPYWEKYKVYISIFSLMAMAIIFTGWISFLPLYVLWPIVVISFGACKTPIISKLDKAGDPSYGIYIYGWVIQQILMLYIGHRMGLYSFMGLSILLSIVLGYISWYTVEKKALRLKKKQSQYQSHPILSTVIHE